MDDQQQNHLNQSGQDDVTNPAQDVVDINENIDLSTLYSSRSKLQTFAELQEDKKSDNSEEDNSITSSGIGDRQSDIDGGADTASQKTYGDIELNKGLESQAKDEES